MTSTHALMLLGVVRHAMVSYKAMIRGIRWVTHLVLVHISALQMQLDVYI